MKTELLSIKELACELKRGRTYVWAMKCRGFKMPGGRATLTAALIWLESNPEPRGRNNTERRGTSARVQLRARRA